MSENLIDSSLSMPVLKAVSEESNEDKNDNGLLGHTNFQCKFDKNFSLQL